MFMTATNADTDKSAYAYISADDVCSSANAGKDKTAVAVKMAGAVAATDKLSGKATTCVCGASQ